MKDFKVMSEADDSYHIQHKNGKSFTVDKKGLSPKSKAAIEKFCMGGMADGGTLDEVPASNQPTTLPQKKTTTTGIQGMQVLNPPPAESKSTANGPGLSEQPQEWQAANTSAAVNSLKPKKMDALKQKLQTTTTPTYAEGGEVTDQSKTEASSPTTDQSIQPSDYDIEKAYMDMLARKKLATEDPRKGPVTMAHGGQVQNFDQGGIPQSLNPNYQAPAQPGIQQMLTPNLPPAPMPAPTPQVQPQVDPLIQQKQQTNTLLGRGQQQVGALGQQLGGIGTQQQQAYQDALVHQSQLQDVAQRNARDFSISDANFFDKVVDAESKGVDPNRFWNNLSTPNKVLAGISLGLSGLGAVKSGGNMAFQTLQKAIDTDIDAQKQALPNAINLWKINRDNFQNENMANLATQNQLWTVVQSKLNALNLKATNADTQFKLQQMNNDIQDKKNHNNMTLGLLKQDATGGNPNVSQADPLSLVPEMVPPGEMQKLVIDELGTAKYAVKNKQQLMQLYDQDAKDSRPLTGRSASGLMNVIPGYETPARRALRAATLPLMKDAAGRPSEIVQQAFEGTFPKLGDNDSTVEQNRRTFENMIDKSAQAPTAKTFGINMENFAPTSTNPASRLKGEDLVKYNWAKSHPNDPRSKKVLKILGVR